MVLTKTNFIVSYGYYNNSGKSITTNINDKIKTEIVYTPNEITITFNNYYSDTLDTYVFAYPFEVTPSVTGLNSIFNVTETTISMPINTRLNGQIILR